MPYTVQRVILFTGLVFCALLWSSSATAQSFTAEKVLDNGDDNTRFVWVILAEGYTVSEKPAFDEDAEHLLEAFFSCSPFKEYKKTINIYTLFAPSDESGADHPSQGIYPDTVFDATYETYGITRLLTVDESRAFRAASQVPHFDIVFVLVNDEQYGGSGGSVIVVSTHASASEIALHEAGHVIGGLADEYETPYPGFPAGDSEPNVTFQTNRHTIPWAAWIDDTAFIPTPDDHRDSIGLFEGARYLPEDIYRPTATSKMRSLNQPFYEINIEALLLNIYSYVDPIVTGIPAAQQVHLTRGEALQLSVEPIVENTYDVLWEKGTEPLLHETETTLTLSPSELTQGTHNVTVWLSDSTDLVRTDPSGMLTSKRTWTVVKDFCSGSLTGSLVDSRTGRPVAEAAVTVLDSDVTVDTDEEGTFVFADLSCGEHTVTVDAPGYALAEKRVTVADGAGSRLGFRMEPVQGACYITGTVGNAGTEKTTLRISGSLFYSIKTEADGSFTLGPLEPGEYNISPQQTGYRFFPESHRVTLQESGSEDIYFTARKQGFLSLISGFVTGELKKGVIVTASGNGVKRTTVTTARGRFVFKNMPPGTYTLKALHPEADIKPGTFTVELGREGKKGLRFFSRTRPGRP